MAVKVLNQKDVYFLFNENQDQPIKYIVKNSGIYLVESGDWIAGIEFANENGHIEFVPYSVFHQLHHNGFFYKEGNERMASFLRRRKRPL